MQSVSQIAGFTSISDWKKLCECLLRWRSGHWSPQELQLIMAPRCKLLLSLHSHSYDSSWPLLPPLSPFSHRQVQLHCQAKLCLPPSLYLLIFLSVFKESGLNSCMGTSSLSLPSSDPPPPPRPRQMLLRVCVWHVRACVGHSPRVNAIFPPQWQSCTPPVSLPGSQWRLTGQLPAAAISTS